MLTDLTEPLPATSVAPITRDNLRRMVDACNPETLAGTRDRLLLVMGWRYALRRGQLAALAINPDRVPLDTETGELYQDWMLALAIAAGEPVLSGPVFRRITRHDTLWSPDSGLSGDGVNDAVQRAVHRARLPEPWRYSAQSLRLGGRVAV